MKNKKGFTLTEILITMTIITIVVIVTFTLFSPQKELKLQELTYRYAAAYRALDIAVHSLTEDEKSNPFTDKYTDDDGKEQQRNNFKSLCDGIGEYFNTKGVVNCDDTDKLNVNDSTDFSIIAPNIKTLNGMNVYVADVMQYVHTADPENPDDEDITFKFFMIYVDINANKKGEHTLSYDLSKNKFPDVFAFAVVPTGNVIPLGIAEYNRLILPVKIAYVQNGLIRYTQKYSYHEAKHYAWGWYDSTDNTKEFKENIPYTYNDYIKEYLEKNNSKLYDGLDDITYNDSPLGVCKKKYNDCSLKISLPKYMK